MKDADRLQLHFGPCKTPRFGYGKTVHCQVRGKLRICGITDALVPWPIGQRGPIKTMVIYGALARAPSVCGCWPLRRTQ